MIPDHIFNKHRDHKVVIDQNPKDKKGQPVRHLAALRCVTCGKHLKWMSGSELIALGYITENELEQWQTIQRNNNTIVCEDAWL
jgi:hypothetical protein